MRSVLRRWQRIPADVRASVRLVSVVVAFVAVFLIFVPGALWPDSTDDATFLDGFWAQLVATFLAIAIGVPVALAMERWTRWEADERQQQAERERFRKALRILQSKQVLTRINLRSLDFTHERGHMVTTPINLGVDVWSGLRPHLEAGLDDALYLDLVHWFSDAAQVERMVLSFLGFLGQPANPAIHETWIAIVESAVALEERAAVLDDRLDHTIELLEH